MENICVQDIADAVGGKILCGDPQQKVENISTDSRVMRGNDLFIPIIGEKNDGHTFIERAFSEGAVASFTSEHDAAPEDCRGALIRVDDTVAALQDLGRYLRGRLKLPLIGVTGSVGKTTTREMCACALSAKFRTFRTPANHNSQIGVPITISEISSRDEIGVLELGMSEPGEMSVIAKIAKVDAAIMTNIGVAHIENLGSRENILKEKLHIQDGMAPGSTLIVNGDNDLLRTVVPNEGIRLLRFGTNSYNDCRAEDVELEDGCAKFTYVHGDVRVPVKLQVLGEHMMADAMAAMTAAELFGVDPADAAAALGDYKGFKGRQMVMKNNGITVIDDTYNASPTSMKAALRVLASMHKAKRRIAVLSDMLELGEDSERYHRDLGSFLAGLDIDMLVVYGNLAKEIAKGAFAQEVSLHGLANAQNALRIESFTAPEDMDEMIEFLKNTLTEGDTVLFKGSNSMNLRIAAEEFEP